MSEKVFAKVTQRFKATADRVFDSWTNAALVRRWMQSALQKMGLPGDVQRIDIDPQLGGEFLFSDNRSGIETRHWGKYLEFERPTHLAFTWIVHKNDENDPSVVRLNMVPEKIGCTVTLEHEMDAKWSRYVARTEAGWSNMLQAIAHLLEE